MQRTSSEDPTFLGELGCGAVALAALLLPSFDGKKSVMDFMGFLMPEAVPMTMFRLKA
jgi:hypothetical protein